MFVARAAANLQWGRSVNAAETRRRGSCGARPRTFNGAAALTLRKPAQQAPGATPGAPFNGAAALTLRKRTWWPWSAGMGCRFNGAAALTLRKPLEEGIYLRRVYELQWGRSVNAAETSAAPCGSVDRPSASMGPQR